VDTATRAHHRRRLRAGFGAVGWHVRCHSAQRVIPQFGWVAIFWIGAALPLLLCLAARGCCRNHRATWHSIRPSPRIWRGSSTAWWENPVSRYERFHVAEPVAQARNWLRIILSREYRRTTLLLWAAFAINTTGLYSYVNWLPTVLTSAGFTQMAP